MTGTVYYDGLTARRREVSIAFGAEDLIIADGEDILARWCYTDLRRQAGPSMPLRLRSEGAPELARIEIRDESVAEEAARRSPNLNRTAESWKALPKIVGWSLVVATSLLLTAVFLMPIAADRLAPLVPVWAENRLGELAERQVTTVFGKRRCDRPDGAAALAAMTARLATDPGRLVEIRTAVLDSPIPNAIALPGGRIYLFRGLLQQAEDPDEIAGVLAHEIGHVARRDSLRKLIQTGGSSFLLGLLFGDVSGAGAGIWAIRTLLDTSYSRDAERAADAFAARTMTGLSRPPVAMGRLLSRIAKERNGEALTLMRTHPITRDRITALESVPAPVPGQPLLTAEEWNALKQICAR